MQQMLPLLSRNLLTAILQKMFLLSILCLGQEDLDDALKKIEQTCDKKITSKIVTLATPVEENG